MINYNAKGQYNLDCIENAIKPINRPNNLCFVSVNIWSACSIC